MTGLLYKELKQNKLFLLITLLAPFVMVFFPCIGDIISSDGKSFSDRIVSCFDTMAESGTLIRVMCMEFGYFIIGMMQSNVLAGDETKKWGYFTASHPKGVTGQVYMKYVLIFMMCGMLMVSYYFFDALFCQIAFAVTGQEVKMIFQISLILFFLQILLRAIEIPFLIRYGSKKGANIKSVMLLSVLLLGLIYLLFGPLPESMEDLTDKIFAFIEGLQTGASTPALNLFLGIFEWVALIGYYISYKISCKLYMKGVEQYDK